MDEELANTIFEHHVKPYANNETARKMKVAVEHYMTCTDPAHKHDIVHTYWDKPKEPNHESE